MEQCPSWETNRFVASQESPRVLFNPNVHYRIHQWPPSVSILSQPYPVHSPHPTSWRSNQILSSYLCLGLPSGLFPLMFPHHNPIHASLLPILDTCRAHLILDTEWTIVIKNWIKQLHTLPVLHFNRCLTTEYSETTAHCNGNFDTDNQIYVP
jgi:hypothetical protein